MSRSVPLEKAMDDAIVALTRTATLAEQRLSDAPVVARLRRQHEREVAAAHQADRRPTMTKDETSKYTIPLPNGKSQQFVFRWGEIGDHAPVARDLTGGARIYEITGLAWSGYGRIAKVEVSADGGASWARPRCRSRCCRWRSRAFAHPGVGWRPGDAAEPCHRRFGYVSRRGRSSSRIAAPGLSTISTELQAGPSHKVARSSMSTRNPLLAACLVLLAGYGAALAESPNLGKTASPRKSPPGTSASAPAAQACRPAAERRARRAGLSRQVPRVPREKGSGKPNDQLVGGQGSLGPGQRRSRPSAVSGPMPRPSSTTCGAPCR